MLSSAGPSTTGKQTSGLDVLIQLHEKFSANFLHATATPPLLLEQVEIKTRAIAEFGQLLRQSASLSPSQTLLAGTADEIFADVTCSVYLAAASLGTPAPMVLRRALELGVAVIYLWDLPHLFWAWKDCDQDLSFKDMLAHIESSSYLAFLRNIGVSVPSAVIDAQATKTLYRNLSNTIHGKFGTMETLSESRYSCEPAVWNRHVALAEQVLDIILNLWRTRFPEVKTKLDLVFPQLSRVQV